METNFDIEKVREDEGKGIAYIKRKSHCRKKKRKIWMRILTVFLILVVGMFGVGGYLISSGKNKIEQKGRVSRPELKPVKTDSADIKTEILDENTLKYKGVKYRYNEEMINLLFIGVDTSGEVGNGEAENKGTGKDAGQADTIFLAAMDNKRKIVTLIPVNRDTMTEISIYDLYGQFTGKKTEQIALSYAFGDGAKKSAELTRDAVSHLFYGLPIHGYFALNTSAIPIVNDMVGGVYVSLLDDFTRVDQSYVQGTKVHLLGDFSETYVRSRMGVGEGTNESRMARQQQYILAFASQAIRAVKENITLPVSLYQEIIPYMVTDVAMDEFSYLASQAVSYRFNNDFIQSVPGETEESDLYMKYLVDEERMYELILEIFYEKV